MQPYFNTEERQKHLHKVLESWVGTPHMHLVAKKGLGADCTLYVWEVMKELNAIGNKVGNIPRKHGHIDYPPDRAVHSTEEVLLKVLKGVPYLKEIDIKETPINGDICGYKLGKSTAHLGIYYNKRIYHSLTKRKVQRYPFHDRYFFKKLSCIFRVMER